MTLDRGDFFGGETPLRQADGAEPAVLLVASLWGLGAVLALLIVGALAAYIPAQRASRANPALVLRQQ